MSVRWTEEQKKVIDVRNKNVLVSEKGIVTNIYDLDDVQRAMDESVHNKADIVKGVIKIHP